MVDSLTVVFHEPATLASRTSVSKIRVPLDFLR
jgi:hypothetical protein